MAKRPTDTRNKAEHQFIMALHEKQLFDELMPALRTIIKSGGGADAVLKKSEPLAASTLVGLLQSEKDEVRRQAAKDIMERVGGKPVERNMTLFADVGRLSENDIDSQIAALMSQTGAQNFLETALDLKKLSKPRKQRRKPKKQDLLESEIIDVTPVEVKPTDGSDQTNA